MGLNKVRALDENEVLLAQEKDEQKKQERIKKEEELKKEKEEFEKRIAKNDPLLLDGQAFVTFVDMKNRDKFMKSYKMEGTIYENTGYVGNAEEKLVVKCNGKEFRLQVEEAPEPKDIIWENMKYSRFNKFVRKQIGTIIGFFIIVVAFLLLLWLKSTKLIEADMEEAQASGYTQHGFFSINTIYTYITTLLIMFMSLIIKIVLKLITSNVDKVSTETDYHINVGVRLWKVNPFFLF